MPSFSQVTSLVSCRVSLAREMSKNRVSQQDGSYNIVVKSLTAHCSVPKLSPTILGTGYSDLTLLI